MLQAKCKSVHKLETDYMRFYLKKCDPPLMEEIDVDAVDSMTKLWTTHARNIDTPNFDQWINIFS